MEISLGLRLMCRKIEMIKFGKCGVYGRVTNVRFFKGLYGDLVL